MQILFLLITLVQYATSTHIAHANTLQVITATASWCDESCNTWTQWIQTIQKLYPQIQFIHVDVDSPQAKLYNFSSQKYTHFQDEYIEVPTSIFIQEQQQHPFVGSRTYNGINQWIKNALHGQYHPIFATDNIRALGEWDKRFNASITVISNEEPIFGAILAEIPSLGFAWGMQNYSETPAIFFRNTHKQISMAFDFQWKGLLKKILPPLIPQATADTDLGIETIHFFADYYVNIITNTSHQWLESFSKQYDNVAFIIQKTNSSKQRALVQKRSVQYTTEDISENFKTWFQDIWKGKITPTYRKSTKIQHKHSFVKHIEGDTLWQYAKNKLVLYTYSLNKQNECLQTLETYQTLETDTHFGSFDIQRNDHELLPNDAKPGFIFLFKNNTLDGILTCKQTQTLHDFITNYNHQKNEL